MKFVEDFNSFNVAQYENYKLLWENEKINGSKNYE